MTASAVTKSPRPRYCVCGAASDLAHLSASQETAMKAPRTRSHEKPPTMVLDESFGTGPLEQVRFEGHEGQYRTSQMAVRAADECAACAGLGVDCQLGLGVTVHHGLLAGWWSVRLAREPDGPGLRARAGLG